jgi:hypothetical protein
MGVETLDLAPLKPLGPGCAETCWRSLFTTDVGNVPGNRVPERMPPLGPRSCRKLGLHE